MGTVSVLGNKCLEITPDPVSNNSTELIPRSRIVGIYPVFEERQPGNTGWTYPYNTITKLRFCLKDGRKIKYVDLELQSVSNQVLWSGGTLSSITGAFEDVVAWLEGGVIPDGSVTAIERVLNYYYNY